ncbi:6303_t:CDS:2 [Paraglomus occultum]|uniref:6303_t:CDS:1 n=1 Tax=Paraglomus occultum TaxID=144539 RepID=A0A9N9CK57_9GLOM|nr:6303_t:CDS:2 [Paraglomus occultum]
MPKIFFKSDSSLAMARYLDAPWSILYYMGRLIPKPIRDSLYDRFANRRYESFGRTNECQRPIQEYEKRFIDWRESNQKHD